MFHKELAGEAQVFTDATDLVFEAIAQGLNEGEGHFFRKPANVVMGLDRGGRPLDGHGFDDIWIESSLHQIGNLTVSFVLWELEGLFGEDGNECGANNFAFALWVSDAFELRQKTLGSVDANDAKAEAVPQHFQGLLELIFAE